MSLKNVRICLILVISLIIFFPGITSSLAFSAVEIPQREIGVPTTDNNQTGVTGIDQQDSVQIGGSNEELVELTNNMASSKQTEVDLDNQYNWQIADSEGSIRTIQSGLTEVYNADLTNVNTQDSQGSYVIRTTEGSFVFEAERTVNFNDPQARTLQNPSFESSGGWDFSDTDVQRSSVSDPSFDGSFSASMKNLTQDYDGRILESDPITVTDGVYYNAEIHYNIQSPSGSRDNDLDEYSVEIVWLDSSGSEISDPGVFGDFSNTGGIWKEESFSRQAPSNAESAKLRIRAKEGATNDPTVYWDSASLNEFSNQLSNPSFESTGSWDFSDTDVQRSSVSDPSFDGSFSASMKNLTQDYDGRILESDPISVNAGERYQFGAYYNIQAPNGGRDSNTDRYSVAIVWFDGSGSEISDPGVFGDFPNSPSAWNEVSSTEIAPPSAESAKLRIRAKEGGTNDPNVYWDSAFIRT